MATAMLHMIIVPIQVMATATRARDIVLYRRMLSGLLMAMYRWKVIARDNQLATV